MPTEHLIERRLTDAAIDPNITTRAESAMFRAAKKRLRTDGHYRCWICGTADDLQVHHYGSEWMYQRVVNFSALQTFCESWDAYGYGRLLHHRPMVSVDDIRNLMVLCRTHHEGTDHGDGGSGTGIHDMTFSTWIMQRLAQPGRNPVPQPGETFAQVLARLAFKEDTP